MRQQYCNNQHKMKGVWSHSKECYCHLRNVQDLLPTGKRHMKDDLENLSKDQQYLFGAMVEYHPSSPKDQGNIHQFGKKIFPRIFVSYELIAGRVWKEIS